MGKQKDVSVLDKGKIVLAGRLGQSISKMLRTHIENNLGLNVALTQFLEGHSSAEFSFIQLQITPAWRFLVILKTLFS